MADIEKDNPPLQGALLSNFYSNLGADIRTLKNLIDEINKINEEKFQEEDLIGRVYEYFLQSYAVASSKEDGEFYTPACVVELIAELIEPYSGTVYDPCCGYRVIIMKQADKLEDIRDRGLYYNNIRIVSIWYIV